jgi:hypothetical protein
LPTTPCMTLPVAVILKRFLTPLLVFSFGILLSLVLDAQACFHKKKPEKKGQLKGPPRHAVSPGDQLGRDLYRQTHKTQGLWLFLGGDPAATGWRKRLELTMQRRSAPHLKLLLLLW